MAEFAGPTATAATAAVRLQPEINLETTSEVRTDKRCPSGKLRDGYLYEMRPAV